jgi:hypothetical protein
MTDGPVTYKDRRRAVYTGFFSDQCLTLQASTIDIGSETLLGPEYLHHGETLAGKLMQDGACVCAWRCPYTWFTQLPLCICRPERADQSGGAVGARAQGTQGCHAHPQRRLLVLRAMTFRRDAFRHPCVLGMRLFGQLFEAGTVSIIIC